MAIRRRDYRIDVTKTHINVGDTGGDIDNPIALAVKSTYPDAQAINVYDGIIVIEFPTTVLTFLMATDCREYYHRMATGETLEPRELHIWRALKDRPAPRNDSNN